MAGSKKSNSNKKNSVSPKEQRSKGRNSKLETNKAKPNNNKKIKQSIETTKTRQTISRNEASISKEIFLKEKRGRTGYSDGRIT